MNFNVSNATTCIERVRQHFVSRAASIDNLDGVSMSFDTWRFNLRKSNTEPLVRLNNESRDLMLLKERTDELKKFNKVALS